MASSGSGSAPRGASASASATDAAHAAAVEQFVQASGAPADFATQFLEDAGWDVRAALELFFDGGAPPADAGPRSTAAAASSSRAGAGAGARSSPSAGSGAGLDPIVALMAQHGVDRATAEAIYEASGGASAGVSAGAGAAWDADADADADTAVGPDGVRAPILQKRARLFDTTGGFLGGGVPMMGLGVPRTGPARSRGRGGGRARDEDEDVDEVDPDSDMDVDEDDAEERGARARGGGRGSRSRRGGGGGGGGRTRDDEDMELMMRLATQALGAGIGAYGPRGGSNSGSGAGAGAGMMFEPPRALLFNGSFEQALAKAKSSKKWLLVNVQDHTEFASHVLNRDLWCSDMVQSVVKASFVFWQREGTSTEGQTFLNLYRPPRPLPYVGILDPRTGEALLGLKLRGAEHELRQTFQEQVMEFLDYNSLEGPPRPPQVRGGAGPAGAAGAGAGAGAGASAGSSGSFGSAPRAPPAQLRAEDAELAAALAASLAEVHAAGSASPASVSPAPAPAPTSAPAPSSVPTPSWGPVPAEPAAGTADSTAIQFRFPDGSRAKRRFLKSDLVDGLFAFVASQPQAAGRAGLELVVSVPPAAPRALSATRGATLADADVAQQTLMVQFSP